MRKQIIILLSLLLVGIGFVAWRAAQPNSFAFTRPTITFAGYRPGIPKRAVFFVTNSSPQTILLGEEQKQFLVRGKWINSSTPSHVPPPSASLETFETMKTFSPSLQPGEHKSIAVIGPEKAVWRIQISYQREVKGLRALVIKVRNSWRTRSWPKLVGQELDTDQITSSEISN